jgi:2',3'-cyclic-nucleotide 2'-phosphodiesterase (5'-nucleotidase family)
MKSRRLLARVLIAAAAVLAWGYAGSGLQEDTAPPIHVTVLFFNDLHGHLQPFVVKTDKGKEEVGGRKS